MKSIDIASRLSDGQIQALPRHTKIQPQASKHPKKLKMSDLRGAEKTVFYFLIKNMQRLVLLLIFQVSLNEIDFLVIIIIDVIRLTISGTFLSVIQG